MLTGCAILYFLLARVRGVWREEIDVPVVRVHFCPPPCTAARIPPPLILLLVVYMPNELRAVDSPPVVRKQVRLAPWLDEEIRYTHTSAHVRGAKMGKNAHKISQVCVCVRGGPTPPSANNGEKIRNKNKGCVCVCVCTLLWFRVRCLPTPLRYVALRYVHIRVRVIERCVTLKKRTYTLLLW